MANATSAVSPLSRRMIDDMTLRNLSPATQRFYLHAVAKFARVISPFCVRHHDEIGLIFVGGPEGSFQMKGLQ